MSSLRREKNEVLERLEEWRRLEDQDFQYFTKVASETESEYLKSLFRRISYDSLRHSGILSSVKNILVGDVTRGGKVTSN